MKCEVCLNLLEEYLDDELAAVVAGQVEEHLITCGGCASEVATLKAEHEIFMRYERGIEVSPSLWNAIAERTAPTAEIVPSGNGWLARLGGLFAMPSFSFAGAVAVLLLAILAGGIYLLKQRPATVTTAAESNRPEPIKSEDQGNKENKPPVDDATSQKNSDMIASKFPTRTRRHSSPKHSAIDQSDVLSSDFGYVDIEDQDTAKHIEQTQNLLRSIRNLPISDNDDEVDVTYDKALSRRLLNENIVLRRDAEMKAKFPTKTLLSDLEPFLIDIANLPDQAKPYEVRTIKDRVQKTEIVAALSEYQGRQ